MQIGTKGKELESKPVPDSDTEPPTWYLPGMTDNASDMMSLKLDTCSEGPAHLS
jgi:hypothetical protein